jgi:hypothetical protein
VVGTLLAFAGPTAVAAGTYAALLTALVLLRRR